MGQEPDRGRGPAVVMVVTLIVLFVAAYAGAMRATVGFSDVQSDRDAAVRDQVYLAVHGSLLVAAAVVGFVTGRWVNGMGLAHAVLFVVTLAVAMVAIQVASFELACGAGWNGIIRHWHC